MTDRRLVLLAVALIYSANYCWLSSIAEDHGWMAVSGWLLLVQTAAIWIEVSAAWTVWRERRERRQVS